MKRGELEQAIPIAGAVVDAVPRSPLAHSLLAFALHCSGRSAEAASVARAALLGEMDPDDRAYLQQFVEAPGAPRADGARSSGP